jgi:antitoxin component YwqK of YwqJK toxin-antitoxin module
MKSLYTLVLSLILISCQDSIIPSELVEIEQPTECDCNELILDHKYNRFYLSDRKKPFTGECKIMYSNGQIKTERNYFEGKYHGDVIDYYDNGQIEMITEYNNHFINGFQKSYTINGELVRHQTFKRSQLIETVNK